MERTHQYRMAAENLRRTAEAATLPEVRSELLWLASSYERLAADQTYDRIEDGFRVLEIRQKQPGKTSP